MRMKLEREKELAELKEKFDTHNLISKERVEVQRPHLKFLCTQAREEMEKHEEDQMTKHLTIFLTSKEGLAPRDLEVFRRMKEKIRKRYLD